MKNKIFLFALILSIFIGMSGLVAQDAPAKDKPTTDKTTADKTAAKAPKTAAKPKKGKYDYENRRRLTKTEMEEVWGSLIPKLGSSDDIEIELARTKLVAMKLPVVLHLVYALQTKTILVPLVKYNRLISFKAQIRQDLQDWFLANTGKFVKSDPIREVIDGREGILNCDTSEEIKDKILEIIKAMKDNKETVKAPQVLNRMRGQAALAIGEIGDISAGSKVAQLLDEDSNYVKTMVFNSLGMMGTRVPDRILPMVAAKIYPYLFHENIKIRSYAWTALRNLDYRQAVPDLIVKLRNTESDSEKRVISQALEGITMQGFGEKVVFWQRWWDEKGTGLNPLGVDVPRAKAWKAPAKETEKETATK